MKALCAFFFIFSNQNITMLLTITEFENSLVNGAFATLFLTTFFYWFQLGFFSISNIKGDSLSFKIGNGGLLLTNLALFIFLVLRWSESHHFPLSNLYESFLFLAWSLTIGHFLISLKIGSKLHFIIGAITAPSALFVTAFASLTLPENLKMATPLVPALQSNWLMMHVTMMILSYSMLILGSLFSIAIVILNLFSEETFEKNTSQGQGQGQLLSVNDQDLTLTLTLTFAKLVDFTGNLNKSEQGTSSPLPLTNAIPRVRVPGEGYNAILQLLDNLSYRTLGFGFPMLTIGILSGAVWANQAWGSYWSWDPKETWALITWVVFAIYFHFRLNQKLSGIQPAIVASIGFVFLWVCYLGVNILGKGLHSYGWFS